MFGHAVANGYILLTSDVGFANILHFTPGSHQGIIVVRMPNQTSVDVLNSAVLRALREVELDELRGALLIVEADRIRLRRP